jgi:opacity protein-like surface antigen
MRLWTAIVGAVAAAAAMGLSAQAETPFYVSGSIGGYFRDSLSGSDEFHQLGTPNIQVPGSDKLNFNTGLIGDVALGYRFAPHFRAEADFDYFTYTGSTLNPATSAPGFPELNGQTFKRVSGDRYLRYAGTANVFYDFSPIAGAFTPYVGGGLGAAAAHRTIGHFAAADGTPFTSGGGASTEGLGMLEVGVSIAITPNLSLVPAYRYIHFFNGMEDVANVAKVGLRYQF